MLPKQ
jgi:hypothetical protein